MSSNGNLKKYGNTKDLLTEEQQDVLRNKGSKIERLQSEITHLSKPLLQSEGSLNWSKHVTPGTLSVFQDEKSWTGINNIELKKKSNVKEFGDVNGLSWNAMRDSMHLESEDDSYSESGSPITTRLDAKDMEIFGAMPLEEEIVVVKCNNCQRPILPSKFKEHSVLCIGEINYAATPQDRSKSGAAKHFFSDDDEEEIVSKKNLKKKKKTAPNLDDYDDLDLSSSTAKRPPSTNIDKSEKKKAKKERQQKKTTKQKAPLDLDKQCGVIQGLNNMPCTRSLTCKSHSMGAKRAVDGRSQPYDVLLAAYQKKSIGRPNGKEHVSKKKGTTSSSTTSTSAAAVNGVGSGVSSSSGGGKSIKNLKKLQLSSSSTAVSLNGNNSLNSGANHSNTSLTAQQQQTNEETFIDSDEEVENVMQAVRLSKPAPLAQKPFFFVKRRRQCFRLRDILLDAITPKSVTTALNDTALNHHSSLDNHARAPSYFQQQQQQGQVGLGFPSTGNNSVVVGENSGLFGESNTNPSFSVR